jgi:hypothetical protein
MSIVFVVQDSMFICQTSRLPKYEALEMDKLTREEFKSLLEVYFPSSLRQQLKRDHELRPDKMIQRELDLREEEWRAARKEDREPNYQQLQRVPFQSLEEAKPEPFRIGMMSV